MTIAARPMQLWYHASTIGPSTYSPHWFLNHQITPNAPSNARRRYAIPNTAYRPRPSSSIDRSKFTNSWSHRKCSMYLHRTLSYLSLTARDNSASSYRNASFISRCCYRDSMRLMTLTVALCHIAILFHEMIPNFLIRRLTLMRSYITDNYWYHRA